MPGFCYYTHIIKCCLGEDPVSTPALQELSVLSLQKIYVVCEWYNVEGQFWDILSTIFEMLHHQVRRNGLHHVSMLSIRF